MTTVNTTTTTTTSEPIAVHTYHNPGPVDEEKVDLRMLYHSVPYLTIEHLPGRFYEADRLSDTHILAVVLCNQKFLAGWDASEFWQYLELRRLFGVN